MKTKKPVKKKTPSKKAPAKKAPSKKAPAKKTKAAKKVVSTVEVSLPTPVSDYCGMRYVPEERKAAVDGLILFLRTIDRLTPETEVRIYGEYAKVSVRGTDAELWIIDEISYTVAHAGGVSGSSLMASEPRCLGLLRAAEGYLGHFYTEPYRPEGWESNIDEKKDAEDRLRTLLNASQAEAMRLSLDVEEAKCAFDWMTADNDDESLDPFGHYTVEERVFLRKLQEFIAKHNG